MKIKKNIGRASLVSFVLVAGTFAASAADNMPANIVNPVKTEVMREGKARAETQRMTGAEKIAKQAKKAEDLALILGKTKESVLADLEAKKLVSDIIKESGMTEAVFFAKVRALHVAEMKSNLDAKVASGKMTQIEADKKLAQVGNHIHMKMKQHGVTGKHLKDMTTAKTSQ
jgi:hypothetical protein